MNKTHDHYLGPLGLIAGSAIAVASLLMLTTVSPRASAAEKVCDVAIVIDRSGSVDNDQLETMRQQVLTLFEPKRGLDNSRIYLAFWSFSSNLINSNLNYNAPFSGFVRSDNPLAERSKYNDFLTKLYKLQTGGGTDYEQGLGYDGYVFGANFQKMNNRDGINSIISRANLIVLMTDGQPNTPGSGGDNNPLALNAARSAAKKHELAGKALIGGIIKGEKQDSLNYVINNNYRDNRNTFIFEKDYSTLAEKLKSKIGTKCNDIIGSQGSYSLVPTVTTNSTVVSGNDTANFTYSVNNSSPTDTSITNGWTVRRVLVERGQSADPLSFGNPNYRDEMDCDELLALINGRGTCDDVVKGQKAFPPGNTSLDREATLAASVTLEDNWPPGTKVCYLLGIKQPTEKFIPADRYSKAACITIGKRPFVQVHGGDLRVGRHFITDGNVPAGLSDPARVATSLTLKASGKTDGNVKTYGSWTEYGIFSPGLVVGFATMSGLQGGYDSKEPNTQEFWSKLTFSNKDYTYGRFTANDYGGGTIPNVREAVLKGKVPTAIVSDTISLSDYSSGLFQKNSGNLNINTSMIQKNKSIIIYVPQGKINIIGDIDYTNGPYSNLDEIPQLILIAKSIVITEPVGHVSAWLIADDRSNGTVSTCDNPATLTTQICDKQLIIDGPILARHLSLRRTAGAGPGIFGGDPAEIINLPANAYLWSQSAGASSVRTYTSLTTELPPYF